MLGTFILTLGVALLFYLQRKLTYWRRRGVSQSTQWTPMGDLWGVGTQYNLLEKLDSMYKKFKDESPAFGFYTALSPSLIVTDVRVLKGILVKDFHNFMDRGLAITDRDEDPLSAHLLALEGEEWKTMRNFMSPTFTSGKIKGMFHIIEQKTADLVEFLEKRGLGVSVKDAMNRFTADVISSTAFGLESRALFEETPQILDILKDVTEPKPADFLRILFMISVPKISKMLKMKVVSEKVNDFFISTVQSNLSFRERNNVQRNDFFNMLVNLKNNGHVHDFGPVNEDGRISFNTLLAQVFIFFVGGYETTANALSFALYYLSKHRDMQQRLREEVRQFKTLDYEAVTQMSYLNKVFNETLRLHPPVPTIVRKAASDYRLENSDIVVPKGVQVQVPVYSIHRDPQHFPDPDRFNPERFSPKEEFKRHPYAFIPFGAGPRNCIGMRFAQLQGRYALAVIIDNFELSLNAKTEEPLRMGLTTMQPRGGIWVDFNPLRAEKKRGKQFFFR